MQKAEVPDKMRASVLVGKEELELREVDVPAVGPDDVLVKVAVIGVCGSDTHFYLDGRIGDLIVDGPIILGHETSGSIVAVGENVSEDRLGELVAIEPQRPCRRCDKCLQGDYNLCRNIEFYGAYPIDGSFSEYAVIPSDFAFTVPENVNATEAALVEPLGVAVYAAKRAKLEPGSRLLISGGGPIGLLIAEVARAFGVRDIVLSDPTEARRAIAADYTAAEVVDPSELAGREGQFDVYIDASGAPAAIRQGIELLDMRGRAVVVGMGMDEVSLPLAHMQHKEIELTGTFRYAHSWPLAIEMVAAGDVDLEALVAGTYGLDEVEDALLASTRDPETIKAVVVP